MKLIQKFKERNWVVKPYHILIAGVGDIITTTIAFSMGLPEANPLISQIFHSGNLERYMNIPLLIGLAWFRYEVLVYLDPKIYKFFGKEISKKSLRRFAFLGLYFYTGFNALQIAIAQYMGLGY